MDKPSKPIHGPSKPILHHSAAPCSSSAAWCHIPGNPRLRSATATPHRPPPIPGPWHAHSARPPHTRRPTPDADADILKAVITGLRQKVAAPNA